MNMENQNNNSDQLDSETQAIESLIQSIHKDLETALSLRNQAAPNGVKPLTRHLLNEAHAKEHDSYY